MQLKTILNRVQKFKCFVYGEIRWVENVLGPTVEVELRARKNSRPLCSGCGRQRPGYDRLPRRRFQFIPMWGIQVFFLYAPRRVDCPACGVRVEQMPWAAGKHRLTESYAWFLAGWARRLSWKEVAEAFRTTWDHVFHSVERAVEWGRAHQDLGGIEAIGIDEIQWQRGHRYLILVYQIDVGCRRLLWIGRERREKTLLGFFRWFGPERTGGLRYVCSDMWKPYLKVIAKRAGQAVHILDRFHIMAHLGEASDEVRAEEARKLKAQSREPVLTKPLAAAQAAGESDREAGDQTGGPAAVQPENRPGLSSEGGVQLFWTYQSPYWAGRFLDQWCTKAMRSKIEPVKKRARMLRSHRTLLLNWFRAKGQFSNGIVEGFNTKAKLTTRKAYGFRTYHAAETALYHALGELPVPKTTHEFF